MSAMHFEQFHTAENAPIIKEHTYCINQIVIFYPYGVMQTFGKRTGEKVYDTL